MEDSIKVKLAIKPNTRVCLFHARKELLPQFVKGDLRLMLDWAEDEYDSIIYWLRPDDDLRDIMAHLERQIKPSGRIWLVMQNKAAKLGIERIQEQVTGYTRLLKRRTVNIGDGETALLFSVRKELKEWKPGKGFKNDSRQGI